MHDEEPPEVKPDEVLELENAIYGLPGVVQVTTAIHCLWGIDAALKFVPFGDLPHAAIRWAGGGKQDQALVQIELTLEQSDRGWRALEFLAYFVRDHSRGGMNIQMRPTALPPTTAYGVQFGRTLRFQIELFKVAIGDDISGILKDLKVLAEGLCSDLKQYKDPVLGE